MPGSCNNSRSHLSYNRLEASSTAAACEVCVIVRPQRPFDRTRKSAGLLVRALALCVFLSQLQSHTRDIMNNNDATAASTASIEADPTGIDRSYVLQRMRQQVRNRLATYSDRAAFMRMKHYLKLPDAIEKEREGLRRLTQRTEGGVKKGQKPRNGMRTSASPDPSGGDFNPAALAPSRVPPHQAPLPSQQREMQQTVYSSYPTNCRSQMLPQPYTGPSYLESSSPSQQSVWNQTSDPRYSQRFQRSVSYPPPPELLSGPATISGSGYGLPLPSQDPTSGWPASCIYTGQSMSNEDDNKVVEQLLEEALQETLSGESRLSIMADQLVREEREVAAAVNSPYAIRRGEVGVQHRQQQQQQQPSLSYSQQPQHALQGGFPSEVGLSSALSSKPISSSGLYPGQMLPQSGLARSSGPLSVSSQQEVGQQYQYSQQQLMSGRNGGLTGLGSRDSLSQDMRQLPFNHSQHMQYEHFQQQQQQPPPPPPPQQQQQQPRSSPFPPGNNFLSVNGPPLGQMIPQSSGYQIPPSSTQSVLYQLTPLPSSRDFYGSGQRARSGSFDTARSKLTVPYVSRSVTPPGRVMPTSQQPSVSFQSHLERATPYGHFLSTSGRVARPVETHSTEQGLVNGSFSCLEGEILGEVLPSTVVSVQNDTDWEFAKFSKLLSDPPSGFDLLREIEGCADSSVANTTS